MELTKNNLYLVAVSGGPDSVFLVHWLWNHDYRNLVLVHVNYHWRKESDHDQEIVELLAQKFELPIEIKTLDAHQEKPEAQNFEAWAREQRYDFLEQLSQKYHSKVAVVGHQENDLIETYLMQKQRKGFVNHFGLKKMTKRQQLWIWRPLLIYKKSFILQWLKENEIAYAWDATNEDLKLQRNKIRSELKEEDFSQIQPRIYFDNDQNQHQITVVNDYLKINQKNQSLLLSPEIRKWKKDLTQRLVYQFFENQDFGNVLLDRKRQLLGEISNRLLRSKKNFWSIDLDDKILIKDYDFLRLLSIEDLPESKIVLNSVADFDKLKKFENRDQIIAVINTDLTGFPYAIHALNPQHIKGVKWQGKALARIMAKHKISYVKRLKTGIIYNLEQKKLLDKWTW